VPERSRYRQLSREELPGTVEARLVGASDSGDAIYRESHAEHSEMVYGHPFRFRNPDCIENPIIDGDEHDVDPIGGNVLHKVLSLLRCFTEPGSLASRCSEHDEVVILGPVDCARFKAAPTLASF
jgi:hypothetical protein